MSRSVQTNQADPDWAPHHDRRLETRLDAKKLGTVSARLIGGAEVRLVNFSNRGVLVESDSRLLIGARASVRITTKDASVVVTGRVVRSRVKGLVNGVLVYDAGINLDTELSLATPEMFEAASESAPPSEPAADEAAESWTDESALPEPAATAATRQTMDDEAMLQLFASVPQDLAELRRLAADNQW